MSKFILFDLDGTLTDSAEGITRSVQYALQHFGIDEPDLDKLTCFVGPPLKEQFMKYCRMSERQAEVAVAVYRQRYAKTGIYENAVYEGIPEVLQMLKAERKILAVASSKPEIYVRQILEHFQIAEYFDEIVGANMDETRTAKHEVIEEALERLGATDERPDVLMVGDRSHDVEGALRCGIQCIGAAYGYGGEEELEQAGAVYIAQTVEDLKILSDRYRYEQRRKTMTHEAEDTPAPQKKESALMKIWRILYPLAIHYGISFVVSEVAVILMFSMFTISQGGLDYESVYEAILDQTVLLTGISNVLAMIPLWLFYRRDVRKRRQKPKRKKSSIYIVTVLFAITASQILNELITFSGLNELFPEYMELSNEVFLGQNILFLILIVGLVAPIVEEVLFRGLILKRIQDYLGSVWAVLLSAVIFGLYHGNVVQFIYALILGAAFGVIMCRTNALSVVCTAHIAANVWSVLGSILAEIMKAESMTLYLIFLAMFALIALISGVYVMGPESKEKNKE